MIKLRPKSGTPRRQPRGPRGPQREETCPLCRETVLFCWSCPCGFKLCQNCMTENAWGVTCNHITWICPDCGNTRSY